MSQPSYGATGTNIFGVNSPIKAQAGADPVKQQQLASYYGSQARQPGMNPGLQARLQSLFDPSSLSPEQANQAQVFNQNLATNNAARMGMLKALMEGRAPQGGGGGMPGAGGGSTGVFTPSRFKNPMWKVGVV